MSVNLIVRGFIADFDRMHIVFYFCRNVTNLLSIFEQSQYTGTDTRVLNVDWTILGRSNWAIAYQYRLASYTENCTYLLAIC